MTWGRTARFGGALGRAAERSGAQAETAAHVRLLALFALAHPTPTPLAPLASIERA